jgi:DNA polymerase-1
MDPSPNRAPVTPLFEGTETLRDGGIEFTYTVGRDHVKDALREMVMSRVPVAVDIESEGLGAAGLNLKTVSFGTPTAAVILDPRDPAQRDLIAKSLSFIRELLFWNSAYDIPNLARNGLFSTTDCAKVTDGLIYARLAEPDERVKKNLTDTFERYLGSGETGKANAGMKTIFRLMGVANQIEGYRRIDLDVPAFVYAAALDVVRTSRLVSITRQAAYRRLTRGHPYSDEGVAGAQAWSLVDREQKINRMLLRRSVKGLRVDLEFLDAYRDQNQAEIDEATLALERALVTPTNAGTLFTALERVGAVPEDHPRTKTGKLSATADHLEALEHPLARAFVRRKKLVKNDEDYLAKVVELASSAGRIHPDTKLLAATTGRTSMGTPPLQQFPEPARGIVLADEGDLLTSIDWSQIEPTIAANLAGESDVIERYEDRSIKADLYAPVAAKAGITRAEAKTVLLGLLYGLGVSKLAGDLTVKTGRAFSVDEASELKKQVFDAMPRVAAWTRQLRREAEQHMKIVTLSGRIVPIPMGVYNGQPSVATHKGINYTVQGSAYDLLAETMVAIEDAGLGDALYLGMHDELIMSTDAAEDIRRLMETPPARLCEFAERVPVLRTDRADMGMRWEKV